MQPASWIVLSVAKVSRALRMAVTPPLFTIVRSISTVILEGEEEPGNKRDSSEDSYPEGMV